MTSSKPPFVDGPVSSDKLLQFVSALVIA